MTWIALASAVWLGILTAISPCPMATNVAAISFIGRGVGNRRAVLMSGLLYTLGRATVYVVLGVAVLAGLAASGTVSRFLQAYLNEILGPILIVLGMVLLGLLTPTTSLNLAGERLQQWASGAGILAAFPLGVLFALSFCPVSAGLFFGALIPLSLRHESRLVLPLLFGIGVDSGIHLVHRARFDAENPEDTHGSLVETATAGAVFYSAMTTTLSFGTLALSNHQGMHGLGVMLSIGMFWTVVANLIVLPALLVVCGVSPPLVRLR